MRVLIVDDEAPARRRLRQLLAAIDDVEVVGEAADGEAALALAEQLKPALLLLDVQMPELDGLAVAASLPDDGPAVVFVTAHDVYALQAFDAQALDYLLKPVAFERLQRALERVRRRAAPRASVPARQLLVPTRQGLQVLPCTDIAWLEAADNYVTLHAGAREYLLRRTLAGLLADLGTGFVRVHRSAAVALAQVASVQPNDKGDALIRLRCGAEVVCSRGYRAALMRRLADGT
ncbi:response regulator transcription factor [Aquincola sp. S2]|uniref:Response regulator transcription factor n=1 Tax=Pseudaquabacterium terrae TaxID=2732868 RepID=A0ABX2EBN4_9BURK|nr:LytTR family DNA-binding domain-containing protein [Aquabacterium terrae]NRF66545.1 response regulator transcription factor [Aquabacterium terrae]